MQQPQHGQGSALPADKGTAEHGENAPGNESSPAATRAEAAGVELTSVTGHPCTPAPLAVQLPAGSASSAPLLCPAPSRWQKSLAAPVSTAMTHKPRSKSQQMPPRDHSQFCLCPVALLTEQRPPSPTLCSGTATPQPQLHPVTTCFQPCPLPGPSPNSWSPGSAPPSSLLPRHTAHLAPDQAPGMQHSPQTQLLLYCRVLCTVLLPRLSRAGWDCPLAVSIVPAHVVPSPHDGLMLWQVSPRDLSKLCHPPG